MTMQNLISLKELTALSTNAISATSHTELPTGGTTSQLVSSTFKQLSEQDLDFKQMINALSSSPETTSNPEKLSQLQSLIGEYSNYVSLVSTLAKKGSIPSRHWEKHNNVQATSFNRYGDSRRFVDYRL
ncbi:hypothetical protein SODG_007413 [Sodalis praecaptivus]